MRSESGHQAAVLGAGSWGTALAIHLASVGHGVTLWGRDAGLIEEMRGRRANPTYLPDITFPPLLNPVASLDEALSGARHVIVAIPSHGLRAVLSAAASEIPAGAVLVSATKASRRIAAADVGVIRDETKHRHPVVALSGPSFAAEVARHLPPRSSPLRPMRARCSRCRTNFADRRFACTDRMTSSASKSAPRSRTSSRSPRA
jgi:glycerol-3-phosphate dehydrogenase (NAD(P)+)